MRSRWKMSWSRNRRLRMQASRFDPTALRTVLPVADTDVFKALYYDRERTALRANLTFIDFNGQIVFETNEAGLKGDPVDSSRKLAVVWGDSVVFGSGRSRTRRNRPIPRPTYGC